MLKEFVYVIIISFCLQATYSQEDFYDTSFDRQQVYYDDLHGEDKMLEVSKKPVRSSIQTRTGSDFTPNQFNKKLKQYRAKETVNKIKKIEAKEERRVIKTKPASGFRELHEEIRKIGTDSNLKPMTDYLETKLKNEMDPYQIVDDEEETQSQTQSPIYYTLEETTATLPLTVNIEGRRQIITDDRVNCRNFAAYALNCTLNSAKIYNSTSTAPPQPEFFFDWCKAIRLMTDCAVIWNSECKSRTESHFSEDSLKGHQHVLNHICEDDAFVSKYEDVKFCLEDTRPYWEQCYTKFKGDLDQERKHKLPATHYEMHFKLCCLRASFRACTSKLYLKKSMMCSAEEGVTMQKFSVVISEGDIYQDCEQNIIYENCPEGDPRSQKDIGREGKVEKKQKLRDSLAAASSMKDDIEDEAVALKVSWHIFNMVFLALLL